MISASSWPWPLRQRGAGPLAGPVVRRRVLDPSRIPKGIDDFQRLTRSAARNLSRNLGDRVVCRSPLASRRGSTRDISCGRLVVAAARGHALPKSEACLSSDGRDQLECPCDCGRWIGCDALSFDRGGPAIVASRARRLIASSRIIRVRFEQHKWLRRARSREGSTGSGAHGAHRRFFAPVVEAREKHQPIRSKLASMQQKRRSNRVFG